MAKHDTWERVGLWICQIVPLGSLPCYHTGNAYILKYIRIISYYNIIFFYSGSCGVLHDGLASEGSPSSKVGCLVGLPAGHFNRLLLCQKFPSQTSKRCCIRNQTLQEGFKLQTITETRSDTATTCNQSCRSHQTNSPKAICHNLPN